MNKILRHETLFGNLTPVYDYSHLVKEKQTNTEIKVFKISNIIKNEEVFIGFGKPNVFIGLPNDNNHLKFDAKSIKRKPSEIVDTRDWAQSGLIFKFNNLPKSAVKNLESSAKSFEGSKYWTCVNANCRVLNRAGFTTGGKDFSQFYFPMPMAKNIIKYGIEFQGKKIEFEIIKTVPNYLESFGLSVVKSQWATFYRHGKRYFKGLSKKYPFWKMLNKLKHAIFDRFKKNKNNKIEDEVVLFPENIECKNDFELTISKPSKLGLYGRYIWGPHAFFEIKQDEKRVEKLLPDRLKEYSQKKKGLFTTIKKNILFSKPVINFIRKHLINEKEVINNCSEKELYNMLRTHTQEKPHKYNLVVTKDRISVIKISIKYKLVDWILSKHVLLSGYSNDVRFAGEFWKETDGCIYFNNNSGTYAPNNNTVKKAELLLRKIFPNVTIISVPF